MPLKLSIDICVYVCMHIYMNIHIKNLREYQYVNMSYFLVTEKYNILFFLCFYSVCLMLCIKHLLFFIHIRIGTLKKKHRKYEVTQNILSHFSVRCHGKP